MDGINMKGEIQKEDYCFDCKRWIDTDEIGHQEHEKLSTRINKPPDLGVRVTDGIGADDVVR